ncbi:MAG: hypothetical protein DMG69_11855 [Acidobacteria bacterium]|nr:MAG: hypothetical protein DMG69_11855 [Acidobacteriota bacterium]
MALFFDTLPHALLLRAGRKQKVPLTLKAKITRKPLLPRLLRESSRPFFTTKPRAPELALELHVKIATSDWSHY